MSEDLSHLSKSYNKDAVQRLQGLTPKPKLPVEIPNSLVGSRISQVSSDNSMSLATWMAAICPYIDFDSARFSELMWVKRADVGLNTITKIVQFSSNANVRSEDIFALLRERFDVNYETDYSFRVYRADKIHPNLVGLYLVAGESCGNPIIIASGDPEQVMEIVNEINSRWKEPNVIRIRELLEFTKDGPAEELVELVENKVEKLGHEAFYPYLKLYDEAGEKVPFTIETLAQQFKQSSSNSMLFIGPPGCGKSTLLKALMFRLGFKHNGVANGNATTTHQSFVRWLKSFKTDSLVVIEDAYDLIIAREKGNDQMSNLLNHVEGISSQNNKVIISTNLSSTNMVDDALIRPGRNFRILEFRELKGKEINDARIAIGKEPIEVDDNERMSLAQALNYNPQRLVQHASKRTKAIGFA